MKSGADVVVVGAGIVGASIAYQLVRRGISVIALDKAASPGEGSTGASSSICRCRYTYPELVRLALHGQETYAAWGDFTGLDEVRAGLHRVGALWMLATGKDDVMTEAARLVSLGVDAVALDPESLVERFPSVSACGAPFDMTGEVDHECAAGEGFLLEPGAGYVDPVAANHDLVDATRARGGEVRFRAQVTAVTHSGERVTGVVLADGDVIDSDLIVNAAGPWCNGLNALAGVDLRWTLTPTRIQTIYRPWPETLGPIPFTVDFASGVYFRPELGSGMVMVGSVLPEDEEEIVDDPDHFKQVPDAEFTMMKLAAFHHRVPALDARGETAGIAGLYTINREDVHPVVGPTGRDGFWVANGFSGHGFKLAPVIGSMIAQELSGESMDLDTDVPMSIFAVDRQPFDVNVKNVLA